MLFQKVNFLGFLCPSATREHVTITYTETRMRVRPPVVRFWQRKTYLLATESEARSAIRDPSYAVKVKDVFFSWGQFFMAWCLNENGKNFTIYCTTISLTLTVRI